MCSRAARAVFETRRTPDLVMKLHGHGTWGLQAPSAEDIAGARADGVPWGIISADSAFHVDTSGVVRYRCARPR